MNLQQSYNLWNCENNRIKFLYRCGIISAWISDCIPGNSMPQSDTTCQTDLIRGPCDFTEGNRYPNYKGQQEQVSCMNLHLDEYIFPPKMSPQILLLCTRELVHEPFAGQLPNADEVGIFKGITWIMNMLSAGCHSFIMHEAAMDCSLPGWGEKNWLSGHVTTGRFHCNDGLFMKVMEISEWLLTTRWTKEYKSSTLRANITKIRKFFQFLLYFMCKFSIPIIDNLGLWF